jgi:hypothetical protein
MAVPARTTLTVFLDSRPALMARPSQTLVLFRVQSSDAGHAQPDYKAKDLSPEVHHQESQSMATDGQLRPYAQPLPPIYREILAAFPRIEPNRRQGYGLAFQTMAADFENRGLAFNLGEIIQACQELKWNGLVDIKNRIFVHPTALGEHLVAIVSGQQAPDTSPPLSFS